MSTVTAREKLLQVSLPVMPIGVEHCKVFNAEAVSDSCRYL